MLTTAVFVFSVQHPVLENVHIQSKVQLLPHQKQVIVDDYFNSGERVEPWIDKKVVKYHRTMEEYYQLLKQAGFMIEDIREGTPRVEEFCSESEYKTTNENSSFFYCSPVIKSKEFFEIKDFTITKNK